jgi:hypothetical protein
MSMTTDQVLAIIAALVLILAVARLVPMLPASIVAGVLCLVIALGVTP